jgi:TonB family protein
MVRSIFAVVTHFAEMAFLTFLFAGASRAQSISGIVYDPTGGVVVGARVMVMQDYVKKQESKSGERGEFSFAGLQAGMYQLQIKQPRFSIFQQTVQLEPGQGVRVYAVLAPARVVEELEISSELPDGVRKAAPNETAVRKGGKVQPPQILAPLRPAYPRGAASRGLQGTVVLFATVRTDGSVGEVVVMKSPDKELAQEAVRVLKTARYQPCRLNGQPVENQMTAVFYFRLR